jgi:hypothetical protein
VGETHPQSLSTGWRGITGRLIGRGIRIKAEMPNFSAFIKDEKRYTDADSPDRNVNTFLLPLSKKD